MMEPPSTYDYDDIENVVFKLTVLEPSIKNW